MVIMELSQILSIEFLRGVIEIILSITSFIAYQRNKSNLIKNATVIACIVLLLMGIYDISNAFEWI